MSPSFKYDKYWGIKFLIHNGKKHLVFQLLVNFIYSNTPQIADNIY